MGIVPWDEIGGAGGGVIVNRLTEELEVRVLLIEAGSRCVNHHSCVPPRHSMVSLQLISTLRCSDYTNLDIEVPGFAATLAGSQFVCIFLWLMHSTLACRSGHDTVHRTGISLRHLCLVTIIDP